MLCYTILYYNERSLDPLVASLAQVSSSKLVPPPRVHACMRLATEFQAYVARTRSLRKVFVSIKGFYYQAR